MKTNLGSERGVCGFHWGSEKLHMWTVTTSHKVILICLFTLHLSELMLYAFSSNACLIMFSFYLTVAPQGDGAIKLFTPSLHHYSEDLDLKMHFFTWEDSFSLSSCFYCNVRSVMLFLLNVKTCPYLCLCYVRVSASSQRTFSTQRKSPPS